MTIVNTIASTNEIPAPRLVPSTRFTLALLVFFAFFIQYSQRVNLPIAIVCMVNKTKPINTNASLDLTTVLPTGTSVSYSNSSTTIATTTTTSSGTKGGFFDDKLFHWAEFKQQLLLGGYWAGYIFTQVPGGWLATTIGAKWVYATSLGTSSIATLCLNMMYTMSDSHYLLIFILRFVIGLAHGVLFPATIALWSVWAVPQERSTLVSIGFSGTHLGTSLTMLSGGLFCRYLSAGWMYLFFFTGILGFVWFALWIVSTAETPHHHKKITDHERDYISNYTGHHGHKRPMSLSSIPWKNMIRSKPLIALIIMHNTNLFGVFFFLTNSGKILTEVMGLQQQYTGYILACGYFLTLLTSLSSGILTDRVVKAKYVTLTTARKISNALTAFIPVLCMFLLCFCDKTRQGLGTFTVLLLLASTGLSYGSGYVVNFADIVPAFSGIVFGIANTSASTFAFLGNMVAGYVVATPGLEQWRKLYIIFGIVYFIGGVVYCLYGTAIPRKWAKFQQVKKDNKLEEKSTDEEAKEELNAEKKSPIEKI